ncbi:MAG TPA: nucleoside-diphosphate kinase [Dehalococcoidia bacterium]|jgi:nucleoside-diphosphate kinase|nr:nucleoside-diphosphate kinase [Chloroflexota bacterium]MEE2842814.1 nucleoside-diphosphate kinase [Chloroflexota bacterium]HIM60187.1 nucleoside-diphosphate kinase [Dehalococcoidia bacterium]|tara:strand:+ start:179 stop:634 length:456 start_codon:yes stop_codon:yes gene_type:complete
MSAERTLVLVKPDGVQRGLAGEIVSRLERTGLQIIGMKLMLISEDLAGRHYAEHSEKPFYSGLVSFITSSPVVALALKGPSAISTTRKIMGVTNPVDAAPGTIRGDLGVDMGRNLIHGSANAEDAAREVALFFDDSELVEYDRAIQPWVVE